jgi:hypothetical protein
MIDLVATYLVNNNETEYFESMFVDELLSCKWYMAHNDIQNEPGVPVRGSFDLGQLSRPTTNVHAHGCFEGTPGVFRVCGELRARESQSSAGRGSRGLWPRVPAPVARSERGVCRCNQNSRKEDTVSHSLATRVDAGLTSNEVAKN